MTSRTTSGDTCVVHRRTLEASGGLVAGFTICSSRNMGG
jgi:hypothetical protein